MIIEELKIDEPLCVRGVTLIPIVKTFIFRSEGQGSMVFSGHKGVAFVVALAPWGRKVLKTSGDECTIKELQEMVPELRDFIKQIQIEQLDF